MTNPFRLWDLQLQRCPDMLGWPEKNGVRTHPETGEPCLAVYGWFVDEEGWYDEAGMWGNELDPTESLAAEALVDRWARWLYTKHKSPKLEQAADKYCIEIGHVVELDRTPADLLNAVSAAMKEIGDD